VELGPEKPAARRVANVLGKAGVRRRLERRKNLLLEPQCEKVPYGVVRTALQKGGEHQLPTLRLQAGVVISQCRDALVALGSLLRMNRAFNERLCYRHSHIATAVLHPLVVQRVEDLHVARGGQDAATYIAKQLCPQQPRLHGGQQGSGKRCVRLGEGG
jgi:hypothetical protein